MTRDELQAIEESYNEVMRGTRYQPDFIITSQQAYMPMVQQTSGFRAWHEWRKAQIMGCPKMDPARLPQ